MEAARKNVEEEAQARAKEEAEAEDRRNMVLAAHAKDV